MKTTCLGILLMLASLSAGMGQHLIGIPKDKIGEYISTEMKGYSLDNSTKNESFNYLKFMNSAGTITLIVFFSPENISTYTKMTCDYSEMDSMKEELSNKYKKTSKTSWEYTVDTVKFNVNLEEKDWYFTVTTRKSN